MPHQKLRQGHKHGAERSIHWVTKEDLFSSDEDEEPKAKTKSDFKKCARFGAKFKVSNRFYVAAKHDCKKKAKQTTEQLQRAEELMEKALVKEMNKRELRRARY